MLTCIITIWCTLGLPNRQSLPRDYEDPTTHQYGSLFAGGLPPLRSKGVNTSTKEPPILPHVPRLQLLTDEDSPELTYINTAPGTLMQ